MFQNKKHVVGVLVLGILVLALPVGIYLLRQQQVIKSRATNPPIVFKGPNAVQKTNGQWVTKTPQVSLELTSPLGPSAGVGTSGR